MIRDGIVLAEAQPVALDRTVALWHMQRGAKPSPKTSACAGCGHPAADPVHVLPDGAKVCPTDACLIAYGAKWRTAAIAALAKMGIPESTPAIAQPDPGLDQPWFDAGPDGEPLFEH